MYYFVSDIHLGLQTDGDPRRKEKLFVEWLDRVSADADALFLVGDIFDFWFEYRRVVPKGQVRTLGKLAELSDRGVRIHFFPGNHDMWVRDYFRSECGVEIHERPELLTLGGKKVFIAHGDNLNVGRRPMLRLMNAVFRSRTARWLFSWLVHPDLALAFGHRWSESSRKAKSVTKTFCGEREPQIGFARRFLEHCDADYFIFGHIHCLEEYPLDERRRAFFLGEWFENPAYAVMDDRGEITLKRIER